MSSNKSDKLTLPMRDRWALVRFIMDALRPHCVPPPPPPPPAPIEPWTLTKDVKRVLPSDVPVLFSTKEGRLKAIKIASKVTWQALCLGADLDVPYERCVKDLTTPVDLVLRNLPMRSYEGDVQELKDAYAALELMGQVGEACGLTAPQTGNMWMFNAQGRSVSVQQGVYAVWASYLRNLCRSYEQERGEAWAPPSFYALGVMEYADDPNGTISWF